MSLQVEGLYYSTRNSQSEWELHRLNSQFSALFDDRPSDVMDEKFPTTLAQLRDRMLIWRSLKNPTDIELSRKLDENDFEHFTHRYWAEKLEQFSTEEIEKLDDIVRGYDKLLAGTEEDEYDRDDEVEKEKGELGKNNEIGTAIREGRMSMEWLLKSTRQMPGAWPESGSD